jgi:hypothetical protein
MKRPRYVRFQFILWALTPNERERYAEEWAAIMISEGSDPKIRLKLWLGCLSFGFQLGLYRIRPHWKVYSTVGLVALLFAPFWLVILFPAFVSRQKAIH